MAVVSSLSKHTLVAYLCLHVSLAAPSIDVTISMPAHCDGRTESGSLTYCIDATPRQGGDSRRVKHRYQDFYVLSSTLGPEAKFEEFPFPSKIRMPCFWWDSEDCGKIRSDKRRDGLQAWLQHVVDVRGGRELLNEELKKFLDPDSKVGYHLGDDQKVWIKKTSSDMLAGWEDVKTSMMEKIDKIKKTAGISTDFVQAYAETVKAEEDLKEQQNTGSEEGVAEAGQRLSDGLEKLNDELEKLESAPFYECGEEDSEDCRSQWANAESSGRIKEFCVRCASEQAENPLRARCNICCSKCGGHAYTCGSEDSDDCKSEFGNAEASGDFKKLCIRCAKEVGEFPLRQHCSKCCSTCHAPVEKDKAEL